MIRSAISTAIHESSYAANEYYKSQAALVVLHQGSDKAVTTSRATVSPMYPDWEDRLLQFEAGEVALVNGDSVACWPGFTNKCTIYGIPQAAVTPGTAANFNSNTTNLTAVDTGSGGLFGVVDDSSEIEAAGLLNKNPGGLVYKLDNTAGSGTIYVQVSGQTGNTNPHTLSVYARTTSSGRLLMSGGDGYVDFTNTLYERVSEENVTPAATTRVLQVNCVVGSVVYFCIPNLTETSYLLPPVPTAGSSVAVDGSEPVVPWPSGLDNNFVLQFTIETGSVVLSSSVYLINIRVDGDNRFIVLYDPSSSFTRTTLVIGGTTYTATINGTLSANTAYKFTILKTVNGMALWKDGAGKQSDTNATADVVFDNEMYLGGRFNQTLTFLGQIREVSIHKVAPNITDAEVLALP